jgi:hypothetical protein
LLVDTAPLGIEAKLPRTIEIQPVDALDLAALPFGARIFGSRNG